VHSAYILVFVALETLLLVLGRKTGDIFVMAEVTFSACSETLEPKCKFSVACQVSYALLTP